MRSPKFFAPRTMHAASTGRATARRRRGATFATWLAIACGLVAAAPLSARAATLVSPMIRADGGTFILCTATNGGTSTAHVVITRHDATGSEIAGFGSCGAGDLAPGASCFGSVSNDTAASCSFEVKGKVRAAAVLVEASTQRPILTLPATK